MYVYISINIFYILFFANNLTNLTNPFNKLSNYYKTLHKGIFPNIRQNDN